MAPRQCCAERFVSSHAERSRAKDGQDVLEPGRYVGGFEMRATCSRQLQRQGDAVESATDVNHSFGVVRDQHEVGPALTGSVDEQLNRANPREATQVQRLDQNAL